MANVVIKHGQTSAKDRQESNPITITLTLTLPKVNPEPFPNQARAMFRLTGQVISSGPSTAVNSLRTPLSPSSCSPHCWPGASDQVVTDLVTSAPLELLLLAEKRYVSRAD